MQHSFLRDGEKTLTGDWPEGVDRCFWIPQFDVSCFMENEKRFHGCMSNVGHHCCVMHERDETKARVIIIIDREEACWTSDRWMAISLSVVDLEEKRRWKREGFVRCHRLPSISTVEQPYLNRKFNVCLSCLFVRPLFCDIDEPRRVLFSCRLEQKLSLSLSSSSSSISLADDRHMSPATFDLLFRLAPRSSHCLEAVRSLMISCSLECQEIEFDSADATTNGPFILLLHTFVHRHVAIDIHKCTHGIENRDRDRKIRDDRFTDQRRGCVHSQSQAIEAFRRRCPIGVSSVRLVQWSVDERVLIQDREELITCLIHSKILLTVLQLLQVSLGQESPDHVFPVLLHLIVGQLVKRNSFNLCNRRVKCCQFTSVCDDLNDTRGWVASVGNQLK